MISFLPARRTAFVAIALVIACVRPAPAQRFPDDPVEKFKQALRLENNKSLGYKDRLQGNDLKYALAFRKTNLAETASKLKSLADISRALLLVDWPVTPKTQRDRDLESVFDQRSREIEQ